MPPGLVMWPVTMLEYHVTLALQVLAAGQPVGIVPHLETSRRRINASNPTSYGPLLTLGESLNPPRKSHTAQ